MFIRVIGKSRKRITKNDRQSRTKWDLGVSQTPILESVQSTEEMGSQRSRTFYPYCYVLERPNETPTLLYYTQFVNRIMV